MYYNGLTRMAGSTSLAVYHKCLQYDVIRSDYMALCQIVSSLYIHAFPLDENLCARLVRPGGFPLTIVPDSMPLILWSVISCDSVTSSWMCLGLPFFTQLLVTGYHLVLASTRNRTKFSQNDFYWVSTFGTGWLTSQKNSEKDQRKTLQPFP
jgi:hypothetical protein